MDGTEGLLGGFGSEPRAEERRNPAAVVGGSGGDDLLRGSGRAPAAGSDDLTPGFAGSSPPRSRKANDDIKTKPAVPISKPTAGMAHDPFVVLETASDSASAYTSPGKSADPLEGPDKSGNSEDKYANYTAADGTLFDDSSAFDPIPKSDPVGTSSGRTAAARPAWAPVIRLARQTVRSAAPPQCRCGNRCQTRPLTTPESNGYTKEARERAAAEAKERAARAAAEAKERDARAAAEARERAAFQARARAAVQARARAAAMKRAAAMRALLERHREGHAEAEAARAAEARERQAAAAAAVADALARRPVLQPIQRDF
ncbi:hypothetical protein ACP4OV_002268 [Aristida adscensionis]